MCRAAIWWMAAITLLVASNLQAEPPAGPRQLEFFEKQVRPLLVEHCYECHGGEDDEFEGGLRVDSRAALLSGGDSGPAVIPGNPAKSLLIEAVEYSDRFEMPPEEKLPAAKVAVLRKWIEMGAPWRGDDAAPATEARHKKRFDLAGRRESHWCWQPVRRPALPEVENTDWPSEALDYFILARLESAQLAPAPAADRLTLIRRLTFDLIGLPPTRDEIESFLRDERPGAVDRLIDRLLASPQFGEKWARHWLDLMRYAETFGHEFDYPIHEAWRYRDYLVRAFNADVPYDQFIREQIAGDLLDQPRRHPIIETNESVLGTISWLLGESVHAPVDVRFDQANRIDNQIDVFGKAFLGLTIACARCHDHKFDAISTADYYAMFGVMKSSRRGEAFLDPHRRWDRAAQALRRLEIDTSSRLAEIAAELDTDAHESALAERLEKVLHAPVGEGPLADESLDDPDHPAHSLRNLQQALAKPGRDDTPASVIVQARERRAKLAQSSGSDSPGQQYVTLLDFSSPVGSPAHADAPSQRVTQRFTTGWAFAAGSGKPVGATLDLGGLFAGPLVASATLHSGRHGKRLVGVWRSPTFTLEHPNIYYRIAGRNCEVRMIVDGYTMVEFHSLLFKETRFPVQAGPQWKWHRQAGDTNKYIGHDVYIEVRDLGEGWVAIDKIVGSRESTPPPPDEGVVRAAWAGTKSDTLAALTASYARQWRAAIKAWRFGSLNREQVDLLNWTFTQRLVDADPLIDLWQRKQREADAITASLPGPIRVPAMVEGTPRDERIFIRGSYHNLGKRVRRGLITALARSSLITEGTGRREIADLVASRDNPLTARVMVNRLWHHLFGRGIVPTVDNFGVLGRAPSHPELLDYLAADLMDHGWSLKRMIRSIVRSRTYQMSSRIDPANEERDPANLLWHRMAVRRLPAEAIRDAVLAASSRLNLQMSGPPIPIYIPPSVQGRGRPSQIGPVDGKGRRTLYLSVRRKFLHSLWASFDGPNPFTTIGRRNVSNVPAQALTMMNDPLIREQAKEMARRLPAGDTGERLESITLRLYSRPPTEAERAAVERFLARQRQAYRDAGQPFDDRDVWTDVCHSLLNTKEFLFLR